MSIALEISGSSSSGNFCSSISDRAFVPLSLQTLTQLSTLGHFLEPDPFTLCTACSSPEAQLWLKGLISLLSPLFSFSVKTCVKSFFYSVKYTCMCHLLNHPHVTGRSSKEMLDILTNNWLETSLGVLIVNCSIMNGETWVFGFFQKLGNISIIEQGRQCIKVNFKGFCVHLFVYFLQW